MMSVRFERATYFEKRYRLIHAFRCAPCRGRAFARSVATISHILPSFDFHHLPRPPRRLPRLPSPFRYAIVARFTFYLIYDLLVCGVLDAFFFTLAPQRLLMRRCAARRATIHEVITLRATLCYAR